MTKVDVLGLRKFLVDRRIFTARDLARVCGVSNPTAEKVLRGEARPSSKVMYAIVDVQNMAEDEAGRIFLADKLRIT